MERQHFIEQLKQYGELHPFWNIKIFAGEKVSKMVSFSEAVKLRSLVLHTEKFYVFEIEKGQIFVCNTPEESFDIAVSLSAFDFNTISIGDYVDFGSYGKFYVQGENIGGTKFLVTSNPAEEPGKTLYAFYIEKHYAESIIKKCTIP